MSAIRLDADVLQETLAVAGRNEFLRQQLFDALRRAEEEADDPATFRDQVRWPLVRAALQEVDTHRVMLEDGLIFDVAPESRIEKALLLSPTAHPDHVWEPQTTRLLLRLADSARHVLVGGAYIGDHVLPIAKRLGSRGEVHAFEPMPRAFRRLLHNIAVNGIENVRAHRRAVWDTSGIPLCLAGDAALASCRESSDEGDSENGIVVTSVTVADYVREVRLPSLDLISLDLEGGEERALRGAVEFLDLPTGTAPNFVFEIHRDYVDWTAGLANTSVAQLLLSRNYSVYAIRDFHDNYSMAGQPIEVIPIERVYLGGPPHGFNMLATKDPSLLGSLGLKVVNDVSPKLILHKDPALHHPVGGLQQTRR
ncbi:MAG: FkbM family methyltransferase [Actinomycetota bacterium]|nr:FkbM family methyltransferase [Actinomycetota bacterium]